MENQTSNLTTPGEMLSFDKFKDGILHDYYIACLSRETSLLGRREVLTGKAKFGIFGDGKEVAQVAMAKFFKPGDWRSGYYRDQTFMFAIGVGTPQQYFAQLYADPNPDHEPFSVGRQMNSHYTSRNVDAEGNWLNLAEIKNTATDMAPTAAQMPRSFGLAYASKSFREVPELRQFTNLSHNGNEVCFCTIGDASTSEGHFWETVNAAGVAQVPLVIFVWDDGYGISVPREMQTTKGSISAALKGFEKEEGTNGFYISKVKGWDYMGMIEAFEEGISLARETHTPVLFHVDELTQPQGHSTSGSHERYKSTERLEWERERDCLKKMKEWILKNGLTDESTLEKIETDARSNVKEGRDNAWKAYLTPIKEQVEATRNLLNQLVLDVPEKSAELKKLIPDLVTNREPLRKNVLQTLYKAILICGDKAGQVAAYYDELCKENAAIYNSNLLNEGAKSALKVPPVAPVITGESPLINGYEILNHYFDRLFASNPKVLAFGEDLGQIGDVNQGFAGLQKKHGAERISDTGIHELSIMGRGIGLALRGLRPIAEIQYLDYLVYGLQPLTDDVASLQYRTGGQQFCPLIIRSRGHRLEGIWHSGSPMGMIINSLRGIHICVPRNMVQAAGMYNTLLQSNDPGLIVESLNGYRLKERLPENLETMTVPLGVPELLQEGSDITIVSYGSTLRIIQDALNKIAPLGISCDLIDVQTLLPFDIHHRILDSLKKTNRIVFIDEDVPGGAAAFMFNKVMEEQGGYRYLDVAPRTVTAKEHRPGYGSDGDYFSKPNAEEIAAVLIDMMRE
ncbi:alpha-ketoacid dehydrogenase subunit alpha/beta [Niabella drilacis]|uniref:3-methyl-2-oxobutanoate dehydrogenase (2-methylpropanoyl-transferring) n=1 Tax=Niabella drilacis (strain DSM 25811 / CCM 8410 / CCUG 62505 / LMG 26954 / E90) TaxID=1285928 RepID=A0A1G6I0Y2_NIADE|nr:alpha-ketoacid dehydrogenase subunit alpha/beta [Niabella drilacis]SDC00124.1 Pyruvate/2-oxoglutarate/acetoin dehydrogenase complex, dehydrogenase (E1) component [Niabella drilacis]